MQHKDVDLLKHSLYTELYNCYAARLFAYAYQQIRSREDAEDIVLDVFLSALQNEHFAKFDAKKQEAWLWAVTRNKIVDEHRRAVRRQHVPIEWLNEPLYEEESLSPEQLSLKHEEYAHLYSMLQTLPAVQQDVLRLRFGHGLKCEEIAPVVAKSEGAVRMIVFRTLHHLRTIYKDLGRGDK
jgi:RNA polymerase sigma factor (sigma-70 family)